jgi:hypothetical protein
MSGSAHETPPGTISLLRVSHLTMSLLIASINSLNVSSGSAGENSMNGIGEM